MNCRPHEHVGKDYFATTRWTVVLAAGTGSPQANQALAQLCQNYWVPLYAYLRKKGHKPADAEDIVQAFLARLIEKTALAAADPNRGRFRSFLISSLQNFVANRRDRELAHKRGGNLKKFSLDFNTAEEAYHREPWTDLTPEKIFDRRWAIDLLNLVLSRLQDEYAKSGKSKLYERLRPALTGDAQGIGYAEIASELQISSDAIKMAVSRMRKRYRELLRQNIADTVASPEDVDDELRHLFSALSG
ncbi:MAG TPA: sigma-70 family RNA polymerase sigma factor [Tepidisphaeraceae bacterium]|jgi:RNA polymerase sigma-70 factor (ECF subfamily)